MEGNFQRGLNQDKVEISISLGDITNKTEDEINSELEKILNPLFKDLKDELECSISVKGTVNVGVAKVEITVEVSGPCSEVRSEGKKIANQILKEIKETLLN